MRGAPGQGSRAVPQGGIIPAYAGSTSFCLTMTKRLWDHPRVCGEHRARSTQTPKTSGSSPRMRGALLFWIVLLLHSCSFLVVVCAVLSALRWVFCAIPSKEESICVSQGALMRQGDRPKYKPFFWLMNRNPVYRQKKSRFFAAFIGYGALLVPVAGFPQWVMGFLGDLWNIPLLSSYLYPLVTLNLLPFVRVLYQLARTNHACFVPVGWYMA